MISIFLLEKSRESKHKACGRAPSISVVFFLSVVSGPFLLSLAILRVSQSPFSVGGDKLLPLR